MCRELSGIVVGSKDSRFRRVWAQINFLDGEDVVLGVFAVLERVLARHREVGVALVDGRACGDSGGQEGGG